MPVKTNRVSKQERQPMKDPILFWNDIVMEANRLDHTGAMEGEHQAGPTLSSRATAIVHLAMHGAYFGVAEGSLSVLDEDAKEFRRVTDGALVT